MIDSKKITYTLTRMSGVYQWCDWQLFVECGSSTSRSNSLPKFFVTPWKYKELTWMRLSGLLWQMLYEQPYLVLRTGLSTVSFCCMIAAPLSCYLPLHYFKIHHNDSNQTLPRVWIHHLSWKAFCFTAHLRTYWIMAKKLSLLAIMEEINSCFQVIIRKNWAKTVHSHNKQMYEMCKQLFFSIINYLSTNYRMLIYRLCKVKHFDSYIIK